MGDCSRTSHDNSNEACIRGKNVLLVNNPFLPPNGPMYQGVFPWDGTRDDDQFTIDDPGSPYTSDCAANNQHGRRHRCTTEGRSKLKDDKKGKERESVVEVCKHFA